MRCDASLSPVSEKSPVQILRAGIASALALLALQAGAQQTAVYGKTPVAHELAAASEAQTQAGNSTPNALSGTADTAATHTGSGHAADSAGDGHRHCAFHRAGGSDSGTHGLYRLCCRSGDPLADLQQCGRKLDSERHKLLEEF